MSLSSSAICFCLIYSKKNSLRCFQVCATERMYRVKQCYDYRNVRIATFWSAPAETSVQAKETFVLKRSAPSSIIQITNFHNSYTADCWYTTQLKEI